VSGTLVAHQHARPRKFDAESGSRPDIRVASRVNGREAPMLRTLTAFFAASTVVMAQTHARACGGCFHEISPPPPERSVVTGHRMAFSISTVQTVLWDQIVYSGNPREFAWVLPVKPGAVIEASRDEWFAALDAATQPVINAPPTYAAPQGGCALVACGASGADEASPGGGTSGPVQVLAQGVVGPYDAVTLQSTNPNALTDWLTSHSFDIPSSMAPILAAYVAGGFDFIALRLRPACGVSAMQPVRIVTPGADPTLPLRMVAAGPGATVDLALWILGEGRWQPQNFPNAVMDDKELVWDSSHNLSNYSTLAESLMAGQNGTTWLTEFAAPISAYAYGVPTTAANPTLYQAYYAFCSGTGPTNGSPVTRPAPCETAAEGGSVLDADAAADEGGASPDGETRDAGQASDASEDASGEAAAEDSGGVASPCAAFDDIDVATLGIEPLSMWLVRMRAHLPTAALATDLVLSAAPQTQVTNIHEASTSTNPPGGAVACASGSRSTEAFGSVTLLGVTALSMASILRRRSAARSARRSPGRRRSGR
jgi:hypothetical protein